MSHIFIIFQKGAKFVVSKVGLGTKLQSFHGPAVAQGMDRLSYNPEVGGSVLIGHETELFLVVNVLMRRCCKLLCLKALTVQLCRSVPDYRPTVGVNYL